MIIPTMKHESGIQKSILLVVFLPLCLLPPAATADINPHRDGPRSHGHRDIEEYNVGFVLFIT